MNPLIHFLYQIKSHVIRTKNSHKARKWVFGIVACALLALGIGYWFYSNRYASTDDAYVNAHVVQIAARVSGQVLHLPVSNNQFVQEGQVLFELDPVPFAIVVDKARAQLAIAEAKLQHAQLNSGRIMALLKLKYASSQSGDSAVANVKTAVAGVQLAKSNLVQAELDLNYTRVTAPTNGWMANLTLREGDVIAANQPLFALVSNNQYWVDANFKETELEHVRPGQLAKIILDMYPEHVFQGIVDSISDGSGTVFSLLPPQNAVGNWVKVAQRVPVKVCILNPDAHYPLRIGTTATVTIDTHLPKAKIP